MGTQVHNLHISDFQTDPFDDMWEETRAKELEEDDIYHTKSPN